MARAKLTADWDIAAPAMALRYEQLRLLQVLARQPVSKPKPLSAFHPYRKGPQKLAGTDRPKLPVTALKSMFVKDH